MIPISNEELHNIWSTQGDVDLPARRSGYEIALAPIVPSQPRRQSVPVEMIDWQTSAHVDQREAPFDAASGVRFLPPVRARTVDTLSGRLAARDLFRANGRLRREPGVPGRPTRRWQAFRPGSGWRATPAADVTLKWERWDTGGLRPGSRPSLPSQPITAGIDPDTRRRQRAWRASACRTPPCPGSGSCSRSARSSCRRPARHGAQQSAAARSPGGVGAAMAVTALRKVDFSVGVGPDRPARRAARAPAPGQAALRRGDGAPGRAAEPDRAAEGERRLGRSGQRRPERRRARHSGGCGRATGGTPDCVAVPAAAARRVRALSDPGSAPGAAAAREPGVRRAVRCPACRRTARAAAAGRDRGRRSVPPA